MINVLKSVLKHDVYPVLGCTEPIGIAYAASIAGKQLNGETAGEPYSYLLDRQGIIEYKFSNDNYVHPESTGIEMKWKT